jgi:hypothetical protein
MQDVRPQTSMKKSHPARALGGDAFQQSNALERRMLTFVRKAAPTLWIDATFASQLIPLARTLL